MECERVQISKHFKNKYSFQRHAFLYHEGAARKVFPCSICQKEFSRPDKMKQHLKQAHDGLPKNSGNRKARSLPEDELPPSTLLINPFRGLSDPADMEGKISSIKESGSRCWKVACVIPKNVPKKTPHGRICVRASVGYSSSNYATFAWREKSWRILVDEILKSNPRDKKSYLLKKLLLLLKKI